MYKKLIIMFAFFCLCNSILLPMEEDNEINFSEYNEIAHCLVMLHDSDYREYLGFYSEITTNLSKLSPQEQIYAISTMIGTTIENRSVTKALCVIILGLYLKRIKGTGAQAKLCNLIESKIIHPYKQRANQKIFTKLHNLCLDHEPIFCEKEKKKEENNGSDILDHYSELFAQDIQSQLEFFVPDDSEIANQIIGMSLNKKFPNLTLRDQSEVVRKSAAHFEGSFIADELVRFGKSLVNHFDNQEIDNFEWITVAGTPVRLHEDSSWSTEDTAGTKQLSRSYMEEQLEKVKKEYERAHPRHIVLNRFNGKIIGKPCIFDSIISFALESGQACFFDLQKKELTTLKSAIKNPSFFTDKAYLIPGFDCQSFTLSCPSYKILFLYGAVQENQASAIAYKHPYCVRGYADGSLEIANLNAESDDIERSSISFEQKHGDSIIALLINNHNLYSSSQDSTIRVWDLRNKLCKKVIWVAQPVKNMIVQNDCIGFLIENILYGIVLGESNNNDNNINRPPIIDAQDIQSIGVRDDGFVIGKKDGFISFIKFVDKEFQVEEMDIDVKGPIDALYCFRDTIVAQSEQACSIVHYPFTH